MAETIGSLADKIIITELKIYHMQKQVERQDVDEAHRQSCRERLKILRIQQDDLMQECSLLYKNVLEGIAELKIYRQFKMYNDPRFRIQKLPENPARKVPLLLPRAVNRLTFWQGDFGAKRRARSEHT